MARVRTAAARADQPLFLDRNPNRMNISMLPRRRSLPRRLLPAIAIGVVATLAIPVLAFAHAVVFPRNSAPGAYERYVLRVPNEKPTATTRVEIRFPTDLRVTAFEDVPGWQLEVLAD